MYQVATALWNQIASEQPLKTEFARRLFPLDPQTMERMLQAEALKLQQRGYSPVVIAAFQEIAPLLGERLAIGRFTERHPQFRAALPEVLNRQEAILIQTKSHRLDEPQQRQLEKLLAALR